MAVSARIPCIPERGVKISMTETYDPYQNAIAERVNGILKQELRLGASFIDHDEALEATRKAVDIYNNKRRHFSLDLMTPATAHQQSGPIKKRWKKRTYPKQAE